MTPLKLKADEVTIPARITSTDRQTSAHTGQPLFIIHAMIESHSAADHATLDKLAASKPLFEADFDGAPANCKWRLGTTSYQFTQGSSLRVYQWELTQKEMLSIDELHLQGIALKPYRYAEEIMDGDRLAIHACVLLDETQRQALAALKKPFPVIRKGINDAPREMRFGRFSWSRSEPDHQTKAELYLIDHDPSTATKEAGFLQPLLGNLENMATFSNVAVHRLLDALKAQGVMDGPTIEDIRAAASAAADDWVFSRTYNVDDLDQWLERTGGDRKY